LELDNLLLCMMMLARGIFVVVVVVNAGAGWVDENGCVAAVELMEDWLEELIAWVDAMIVRKDYNAICIEVIYCVCKLDKAPFNIREWKNSPESKLVRAAPFKIGGEFIAFAG
jgi:hypothetical protein